MSKGVMSPSVCFAGLIQIPLQCRILTGKSRPQIRQFASSLIFLSLTKLLEVILGLYDFYGQLVETFKVAESAFEAPSSVLIHLL